MHNSLPVDTASLDRQWFTDQIYAQMYLSQLWEKSGSIGWEGESPVRWLEWSWTS